MNCEQKVKWHRHYNADLASATEKIPDEVYRLLMMSETTVFRGSDQIKMLVRAIQPIANLRASRALGRENQSAAWGAIESLGTIAEDLVTAGTAIEFALDELRKEK